MSADELPPHLNIAVDEEVQQSTVQGLKLSREAEAARSVSAIIQSLESPRVSLKTLKGQS